MNEERRLRPDMEDIVTGLWPFAIPILIPIGIVWLFSYVDEWLNKRRQVKQMENFLSKQLLEKITKIHCTKCGKPVIQITMTIMMGPRGFRRYPVCDACLAGLKEKGKKVPA